MDLSPPRLPPQDLDAEEAILGGILHDNGALAKAMEVISEADFYRPAHQRLFQAMVTLSERGDGVDPITLVEHLKTRGELEVCGGASYVEGLRQAAFLAANMRYHCRIVRDKALLRTLLETSTEMVSRGYDENKSVDELLDQAERSILALMEGKMTQSFVRLKAILKDSLDHIDTLAKQSQGTVTGIPTGFMELDDLLAGLQPSDLIILAARPSMGKTSLALGMAQHAAVKHQKRVGIFSLEMSRAQLVLRMLSSEARVDSHALRTGRLVKEDWWRLAEAAGKLEAAPIYIDDSGAVTVQQMRGKARRLKIELRGLDLLVVDYLQLMQGRADAESRQQEISDISRSLKNLAKELNVPILALSQLSRAVENRKPPIPMLADLRESGAIEQDADVVIFIYREEAYEPDTEKKGIADILVRKHRNGPTGDRQLVFRDKFAKFDNLSDRETL
jgi:replicative DNA helicase